MPTAKLFNMAGDQVGEVALSEAVFGVEPNESVLHDSVKNHLANCRQGTQCADQGRGFLHHRKALAPEGHRPCTRRLQGQPGVDPRRRRVCAEAA